MSETTTMAPPQLLAGGEPSLLTRAYYRLKPFIPLRLRWAIRRRHARNRIEATKEVWPIDPTAAVVPEDWKGWPEKKRFAFVVTHDVESAIGVQRVRPLAKLVKSHGLVSTFNFIPEGAYPDPVDARRWLQHTGFEVGVHDLKHDGRLYESRESFRRSAGRINGYLSRWNAVGFRSGFLLRELNWLHDLDASYDSSTFDTDPFEPQPEGSGTIFPFMVEREKGMEGAGYVELPYTLAQDSTLFLLLGEDSIDIWKRKLDWIAEHGGLALINIHPDFIDFSGRHSDGESYPCGRINELFDYLNSQYKGEFWNPLACDLAKWFKNSSQPPGLDSQPCDN